MITTIEQNERITGGRFRDRCSDHIFVPGRPIPVDSHECYIIYCKTDWVPYCFKQIRRNSQTQYILITHGSDIGIDQQLLSQAPGNISRWYAMNVLFDHPKLKSIPIGSAGSTWIGVEELADLRDEHDFVVMPETGTEKTYKNLVYMNFGAHTNATHRRPIYDYFKDKPWVTSRTCDLSLDEYNNSDTFVSIAQYYDELYNHKYVISPLGNGVDCGRNWQALYVGTIPIIPRHLNIEFYQDLPFLVYDDVEDLTEEYLLEEYDKIKATKTSLEKATVSYWRRQFHLAKLEAHSRLHLRADNIAVASHME